MNPALVIAGKVLTNKWFWIILAVIILLFLVRRNADRLHQIFKKDKGDYSEGAPKDISDNRKKDLESLAQNVRDAFENAGFWATVGYDNSRELALTQLKSLSDTDLKYLSKYYRQAYTTSLYKQIDAAWMYGSGKDEEIISRLEKIGEKY